MNQRRSQSRYSGCLIMRIDLSLAKGLRTEILRTVNENGGEAKRRLRQCLLRRTTPPTTAKGAKGLHGKLMKVYGKSTLLQFIGLALGRYGYWVEWDIWRKAGATDWSDDKLSVTGRAIDMFLPSHGFRRVVTSVCISMHLIERLFQRINTTDQQQVLDELHEVALVAAALAPGLFSMVPHSVETSFPIMLPTPHGAIMGDLEILGGVSVLHFKTFIGGEDISTPKRNCLIALREWDAMFFNLVGIAFELILIGMAESPQASSDPRLLGDTELLQMMTKQYCDILDVHRGALVTAEERAQRQQPENNLWNAARMQQRTGA